MEGIKILGAHGSKGQTQNCVSFQISSKVLIDAGNVMSELGHNVKHIEHLILSHAHFDHIRDLPFIIESYYSEREKPLKIYGSQETLNAVEQHLFNDVLWPKFQNISHPTIKAPALELVAISADESFSIDGIQFTPFRTNHCQGSLGFIVEKNSVACMVCSDTYLTKNISEIININNKINTLFIETSFSNSQSALAQTSKHLTPNILTKQLESIERPIKVFLYHLKPFFEEQIKHEIQSLIAKSSFNPQVEIAGYLHQGQQLKVFDINADSPVSFELKQPLHEMVKADKLSAILRISEVLSGEYQLDNLLDLVIDEAMAFTHADAATLYCYDKSQHALSFKVIRNQELDIHLGGINKGIDWPQIPLFDSNGDGNQRMVSALCALNKKPLLIDDVYQNTDFDFSGTRRFDDKTGYRSKSMLVVPLLGKDNELFGVIQLINKKGINHETVSFTFEDQQSTMALASQAAMSISNALLITQLEALFESFAEAINVAFDRKCFFTGKHIHQVSELAQIISHAINEDKCMYKDVNYSKEMLHTIKIAALVHDVGKIATPESILHKASKLQANLDRIELIKLRFEIYKQALLLDAIEKHATQNDTTIDDEKLSRLKLQLVPKSNQIDDDFAFIEKVNSGKEFLTESDAYRIEQIAQIVFNHKGVDYQLISDDEKTNLLIKIGTLTANERNLIQDHAALSLEMLQALPFPEKYGKIVDIAANHHEKLNGQGYPRGLDESTLTLEDEILVLADIYEALSSSHRPYKKPLNLTEVAKILSNERWRAIHMMPEETVQAHIDLKGKWMFPIHNGSFKLALHPWNEPFEKLNRSAQEQNVNVSYPIFGEIISVKKPETQMKNWWK